MAELLGEVVGKDGYFSIKNSNYARLSCLSLQDYLMFPRHLIRALHLGFQALTLETRLAVLCTRLL